MPKAKGTKKKGAKQAVTAVEYAGEVIAKGAAKMAKAHEAALKPHKQAMKMAKTVEAAMKPYEQAVKQADKMAKTVEAALEPYKQALKYAEKLAKTADTWLELHNGMFGIGGKVAQLFPADRDRVAFSKTDEYTRIMDLLSQKRQQSGDPPTEVADRLVSANGAVTVRMPRAIHAALLVEAEAEGVSLNQLCVAKLAVQLRAAVS